MAQAARHAGCGFLLHHVLHDALGIARDQFERQLFFEDLLKTLFSDHPDLKGFDVFFLDERCGVFVVGVPYGGRMPVFDP